MIITMMFITMMMMTTTTRLMMIKIAMTMIGEVNDDCQRQDDHNAFTQSITPNKLGKDQRPL